MPLLEQVNLPSLPSSFIFFFPFLSLPFLHCCLLFLILFSLFIAVFQIKCYFWPPCFTFFSFWLRGNLFTLQSFNQYPINYNMQPKIVNFKVNQHLYSLRLLLSSISFLSFFPSSLSSSQGKAYLYIFTLLPVSLLIPPCITSLPSGIFSISFKSFLRIIFFFHKSLFLNEKPPHHPPPRVFLKNSFVENTIVH